MYLSKNHTKIIILAFILAFGSCSDWLDLKPYDGVTEGDYWNTKEDVFAILMGCYSSMIQETVVTNIFYWGELRGDIITGSTQAGADVMNIIRGEITPSNKIVMWDKFYTTISYCNKLIARAHEVLDKDYSFDEDLCEQYKAEAVVIRSLMYFYLVRSFWDVPFVTVATDNDQQDFYVGQTDGFAVLDSLDKHLNIVLDDLPTNLGSVADNKGRMTRYAALALLADINLWRALNDNSRYTDCINYCNQVIAGSFSLIAPSENDYEIRPVFNPLNTEETLDTAYFMRQEYKDRLFDQLYVQGNSIETIFELQYPETHPSLADPFFKLFQGTSTTPPMTPKLENLMENIFPNYQYQEYVSGITDVRGSGFSYKNNLVWKWIGTSCSGNDRRPQRLYPNWIVYRLPDVILMKAEAISQFYMNDQSKLKEAYDLIKQIRKRSNAVDTESVEIKYADDEGNEYSVIDRAALEQLLLDERAREFIGEGKRWYDVLRFSLRDNPNGGSKYLMSLAVTGAPPEKTMGMQEKYKNRNFLFLPVYIDEIESNKNLVQNQFYR